MPSQAIKPDEIPVCTRGPTFLPERRPEPAIPKEAANWVTQGRQFADTLGLNADLVYAWTGRIGAAARLAK